MIKNIIFDFGQVLVKFDPEYMTEKYVTDFSDSKLLQKTVFDRIYWDKLDLGTISDEELIKEVCLDREGILEELETKDYSQFSTGQKKRLVLAQMLYRTLERPSIILVDEAVGNVENELIDSQLKAITQVIRNINAMGIIVTHRVDLARRYVDKHYHIGEDGIMREMKQSEQEKDI